MISRETLWRVGEAAHLGWREYWADNPPAVLLTATVPRGVLQVVFFSLLGGAVVGPGYRQFAFTGALVLALSGTNVIGVAAVPLADRQFTTFWRLRTGILPPVATFFARILPYPIVGMGMLVVDAAVAAPLTGVDALVTRLIPCLAIYALMSCTTAVAGLVAASVTVDHRADVVAPNLLAYLVMLSSGAFLPPGRLHWVDVLGDVLPDRHGLAAVRDAVAGRAWGGEVALEVAVGIAWATLGAIAITLQTRRARRTGRDVFT